MILTKDKATWDKLIYQLIYPGILGSMLYEMFPTEKTSFNLTSLFCANNAIQAIIILFYLLDYAHLYGDMEPVIKDPKNKNIVYYLVDIATCMGFLISFICIKFSSYWFCISFFGIVPLLFLAYKFKNESDVKFLKWHICISILISSIYFYKKTSLTDYGEQLFVIAAVMTSLVIYSRYVFFYYDKKSKKFDINVVYPQ